MPRSLIIVITIICCLIACSLFTAISVLLEKRNVDEKEIGVTDDFKPIMTQLTEGTSGFNTATGLALHSEESLIQVMQAGASGLYGEDGIQTDQALFLALSTAYPDASVEQLVTIWREVLVYAQDQLSELNRVQSNFANGPMNDYKDYTQATVNPFRNIAMAIWDYPSDKLQVAMGDQLITGEDAFKIMNRVIVNVETSDTINSGIFDGFELEEEGE